MKKFYISNIDIFLKYFKNIFEYKALINAENWQKMEEIIKQNSNFNINNFFSDHENNKR